MSDLGNLGVRKDLKIVRGANLSISVIVEEGGAAKDLTGYTAAWIFKKNDRTATTLLSKVPTITAATGTIALAVADTDTSSVAWTNGTHTLTITSAGGTITRIMDGEFELVYRSDEDDEPATTLTVETVNGLTLTIAPFDTTQANAVQIQGIAVSAVDPVAASVLRATSATAVAWSTVTYADAYAQGGLPYASAANTISALAIGSAGKFLRSSGTLPAWSTLTVPDTLASGALLYASSANVGAELALGTARQVLQVNAGATAPEWTSALSVTSVTTSADATVGGKMSIAGTALGALAIAGDQYNHCLVSVGFNQTNPLTERHQVAYWTALKGNSFASGLNDGYVIGFETGMGSEAGVNVDGGVMSFSAGSYANGVGSTARSVTAYSFIDETAGTDGNAAICRFNDIQAGTLIGNWFIYYSGTRESYFGAKITVNGVLTFINELSQAGTASYSRMSGGTAGIGATVTAYGSTHATLANKLYLTASGGVVVTGALTLSGVTSTEVAKDATTSFIRVSGGTAGVGANLALYGSTHATNANQATLAASGGLTITAPTTITGATAVTGTLSCTGDLTTGPEHVRAVTDSYIRVSGGTVGNGGNITLYGSTHATLANKVAISAAGGLTITGATVLSGITSTEISKDATTSFLRLSGGTAGVGANITLYGSTHATEANKMVIAASAGVTITGGLTATVTGNASTATTLQTARNINGVAFNGSADITVTAAAGTLTGTTLNATVVTSSLTSVGTLGSLSVAGTSTLTGGVTGGLIMAGGTSGNGEVSRNNDTTYVRLFGGQIATANTPNIALYGATHATAPSTVTITALNGITLTGNVNTTGVYSKGGTQVVGARKTGWGLPTGTLYRTALTDASTQAQFNQAIMALLTDLHSTAGHGLIGA